MEKNQTRHEKERGDFAINSAASTEARTPTTTTNTTTTTTTTSLPFVEQTRSECEQSLFDVREILKNPQLARDVVETLAGVEKGDKLAEFCAQVRLGRSLHEVIWKHEPGQPWMLPGLARKPTPPEIDALEQLKKMYCALEQEDRQPCGSFFLCRYEASGTGISDPVAHRVVPCHGDWNAVAMSADGSVHMAGDYDGNLFVAVGDQPSEGLLALWKDAWHKGSKKERGL